MDSIIKISTNPVNREITVVSNDGEKQELIIYDRDYRIIYSNDITNERVINTENWLPGIHTIQVGELKEGFLLGKQIE